MIAFVQISVALLYGVGLYLHNPVLYTSTLVVILPAGLTVSLVLCIYEALEGRGLIRQWQHGMITGSNVMTACVGLLEVLVLILIVMSAK